MSKSSEQISETQLSAHGEEAIDRWFSFVEEYYKENTVTLSYVLLPNSMGTGIRTPGSVTGAFNLSKKELRKLGLMC